MKKAVIVGDGAIGKTCLINVLTNTSTIDWDDPEYVPTAAANMTCEWTYAGEDGEQQDYEMEIWDTAGQEALSHLRKVAYPGSDVFLVGYDMTSATSLKNVGDAWVDEISEHCHADCGIVLIGTKHDYWEEKGKKGTTWKAGYEMAEKIGASFFVCTSAKTEYGVMDDSEVGEPDTLCLKDGMTVQGAVLQIVSALEAGNPKPKLYSDVQVAAAVPPPVAEKETVTEEKKEEKKEVATVSKTHKEMKDDEEKKSDCQCVIA